MSFQTQFLDVIDRDEAQRRFEAALRLEPVGIEDAPLEQALGRVLAGDVSAAVDVPSFDRSNVDGFAVQAADTFGASEENARRLALLDAAVATGHAPTAEVARGTAMSIATGGMLPRGADAVVMVEHTDVEGDVAGSTQPPGWLQAGGPHRGGPDNGVLVVRRAVAAGAHVAFAGTDIAAGETVLHRGQTLTSRETGVLAAIGVEHVPVFVRPKVAVISTGDELIPPGAAMRPGCVYDSNARILADAVRELGGEPVMFGICHDDAEQLAERMGQAIAACDLVLLSGGTSKGAGDISYRVVSELREPGIVAHGVALKPGKPICLAATGGKAVVILPGFPTSAIFTFHEFVAPVIRRLAGLGVQRRDVVPARMAVKVNSEIGRTEYLLVGLVETDDSESVAGRRGDGSAFAPATHESKSALLAAYPLGKGSGSVTTFSRADGFITIGRHEEIVPADALVEVQLLGRDLRIADLVAIGSHCVGLDYLLGRLERNGVGTKSLAVGSLAGVDAARRGECDVAGVHLLDPASGEYNRAWLTPELRLVAGYGRMQGIVFRPSDERFAGGDLQRWRQRLGSDASLRMVNRNAGSGTRVLVDQLLSGLQPPGYAVQPRSHNAVAAAVAQGRADWGVCIETVARQARLEFLPLRQERYDFFVPVRRWERPAVQAFVRLVASDEAQRALRDLGFFVGDP